MSRLEAREQSSRLPDEEKVDFKKKIRLELYRAPTDRFVLVDGFDMQFVMGDGESDPNVAPAHKRAIEWLFSVCYALKFAAKKWLEEDKAYGWKPTTRGRRSRGVTMR